MSFEANETLRALFHKLWSKAVGTDTYVKKEWAALEQEIEKAIKEAKSNKSP